MKAAFLLFLLIVLVLSGCAFNPASTHRMTGIPALNAGEVPSWDVHIEPLVKRYCVSCHKTGKLNNHYLLTSYNEMLHSGDNAPVIVAKDPNSLLIQLINGHTSTGLKTSTKIRKMPPIRLLKPQYIDMVTLWIKAGMPETAVDATLLSQFGQQDAILSHDLGAGN